jgi:ribonuclease-3 family protein
MFVKVVKKDSFKRGADEILISSAPSCYTIHMLEEIFVLRNYAHIGDAVWELFVREYTVLKTSNAKLLHKITTERVNATFQRDMLTLISDDLTEDEQELARRARNLPIPVGRRAIQAIYRQSTAFEVLIGYWYTHDKERLKDFYKKFEKTKFFS